MLRLLLALLVMAFSLVANAAPPAKTGGKATPAPHKAPAAKATPAATPAPAPAAADPAAGAGDAADTKAELPAPKEGVLRIVVVGDSTAGEAPAGEHRQGWGHYLGLHFAKDKVEVVNAGVGGQTARSFIERGTWKKVLKQQPGMVLVQFGHNELTNSLLKPEEQTADLREYRRYLSAYVETARKAGVDTIILTPTQQVFFTPKGQPYDKLGPFVDSAKQTAESHGVPMVDVHTACNRLYTALGPARTQKFRADPTDAIHLSPLGAWTVSAIIAKQLARLDPRLAAAAVEGGGVPEGVGGN